jgi:hypothetical protein
MTRYFILPILLFLSFALHPGRRSNLENQPFQLPPTFHRNDHILILITGKSDQSQRFGYSGRGTVYKATGTSVAGRLTFSPVTGSIDIPLERRSGADPTNTNSFGVDSYIPPGIYFLHYHRFDSTSQRARHRLGLSDRKCGENIQVRIGGETISRSNLQFHIAFNDLVDFHPDVSKGCITLNTTNFFRLFSDNFFSDDSPLPGCAGHQPSNDYSGQGKILVFITDATSSDAQDRQVDVFNKILAGDPEGVMDPNFDNAGIGRLRTLWGSSIP